MTVVTLETPPEPNSNSPSRPASTSTHQTRQRQTHHINSIQSQQALQLPGANISRGLEASYAVTSVAWAPSCGRSFHLIATGSRDGKVRIWKVKAPAPVIPKDLEYDVPMEQTDSEKDEKWSATLDGEFADHKWVLPLCCSIDPASPITDTDTRAGWQSGG